jgi:hypothetical protein
MYTRKDNSVGEFGKQLAGLVKNWRVRKTGDVELADSGDAL